MLAVRSSKRFGDASQWSDNGFNGGDLLVGEAIRMLGCESRAVNGATGKE